MSPSTASGHDAARRFPSKRFAALRDTSQQPTFESPADAVRALHQQPMFGCHKGDPATGEDLACAGWLAVAGGQNFQVRYAVVCGHLDEGVLAAGAGWPELYASYADMAAAQDTLPEAP